MTQLELIDCLCNIMEMQSKIIREQALFIEEQLTVDDALKREFAKKRIAVDDELDRVEYNMRSFHNTSN